MVNFAPERNFSPEGKGGGCPMSDIKKQSDAVREGCYKIFGRPNIQNTNQLGGLNGSIFVDFLRDFQNRVSSMEIMSPEEMVDVENLGEGQTGMLIDMAFRAQGVKKVSRLAYIIYKKFIQRYIHQVPHRDHEELIMNQFHFIGFAITFIQAFDSIFRTGARNVNNREEWDNIKEDMRGVVRNMTKIPSDIQEGLTSSHDRVGYYFGDGEPYIIHHMEEIFTVQAIVPEVSFSGTYDRIYEKGGYGMCPAAVDGTLKLAFEILFDIYGRVFLK